MKRIIISAIIGVLALCVTPLLFGVDQELNLMDNTSTNISDGTNNRNYYDTNVVDYNNIDSMRSFAPSHPTLKYLDEAIEVKDFITIVNILNEVEYDYMQRIYYKASLMVSGYTNTIIHEEPYRFEGFIDHYDLVINFTANSAYVKTALVKLDQALDVYNYIKPTLGMIDTNLALDNAPLSNANEEPISNHAAVVDYRLHYNLGVLNTFRATTRSLEYAVEHFHYILTNLLPDPCISNLPPQATDEAIKALSVDDKKKILTMKYYLASLHERLAERYLNLGSLRKLHENKMFDNLWDITYIQNSEPRVRDYKLYYLIRKYYRIIDTKRTRFDMSYRVYFDKLGLNYGYTEEKIIEDAGMDVSTN